MSDTPLAEVLQQIYHHVQAYRGEGRVVDYIPALAEVDPDKLGIALYAQDGALRAVGDTQDRFSIQSISKVLALTLVMEQHVPDLWQRLGREPSGTRFNSLIQLELERGIPRNPFINAGALVITDILLGLFDEPKRILMEFVRKLTGDTQIMYDETIAASERSVGYTNAALVNFMKSQGNIHNDVDAVLDLYCAQCAIMMNCEDLAKAFSVYAFGGYSPFCEEQILNARQVKRVNALMTTCGFYDQAGEFAFRVGLPGKSGVSGAIAAVHPGKYSVAVWAPELNPHGNSVMGMEALDCLTTVLGTSIY